MMDKSIFQIQYRIAEPETIFSEPGDHDVDGIFRILAGEQAYGGWYVYENDRVPHDSWLIRWMMDLRTAVEKLQRTETVYIRDIETPYVWLRFCRDGDCVRMNVVHTAEILREIGVVQILPEPLETEWAEDAEIPWTSFTEEIRAACAGLQAEILRYRPDLHTHPAIAALTAQMDEKEDNGMNIPKYLRRVLPNAAMTDSWILGECICPCRGADFRVSVFAEKNGQGYPLIAAYENGFTLKILAECADCGEKHLLFDYARHGFSGAVLGDGVPVPDALTEAWLCPDCGGDIFGIRTAIQPGDYGQYLQEAGTAEPMTEEAYSEAFDWIRIDLQCRHCGRMHEEWISLETS